MLSNKILSSFNNNINKDFYKISQNLLYQKYTFGNFSFKNIITDCLIFNCKCRLTLLFKEFLLADDSCEFLRNFYLKEDQKIILSKILEIYYLYSKIYPNYIILKENKFLYKNIRKKQKMIDENNNDNDLNKKNNCDCDNINNKENELFTLTVRNEIKEFQENSFKKNNNYDNVNDNYNNSSHNQLNTSNTKKINDNWILICNQNLNQNFINKNNNNKNIKNASCDSFWTNDTNNLSSLLNAINDKMIDDKNKNNKNNKIKKKDISYRNINHKFLKILKQQKKKIKSSSKDTYKRIITKKIENKKINDNSRNNNFLKTKNEKIYLNNINITKPISSSINFNPEMTNNRNNMYYNLLTENNLNKKIKKNIHRYYSMHRDISTKNKSNKKKLISPKIMKKKFYSKNCSKERKTFSIKSNENYIIKYLETKNNNINENNINENNIKEEYNKNVSFNSNILYNTNNNYINLRNKKYSLKKYFTKNNLNKNSTNQRYTNYLTESNSQIFINSKKEKDFNSIYIDNKNIIDNKIKFLNNYHTSTNYYIYKNKTINKISNNKSDIKKQKTQCSNIAYRDKIIEQVVGTEYIKKKCFSQLSNNFSRGNSLSKSYNIKKEIKINDMKKEQLLQKQLINSKLKNKLNNIKNNIRKKIIHYDNIFDKNYLNNNNNKSINKRNSVNNYLNREYSQKENININSINQLNTKDNYKGNKKKYLKKKFSPTLTHYNLYKSGNIDISKPKTNLSNNSEFVEYHHEKLFIKRHNKYKNKNIYNNELSLNILENKENNQKISNMNEQNLNMIKSKTEYKNFFPKNKYANKKTQNNDEINKNLILKRFKKQSTNYYFFSKDKINKINNINEFPSHQFNSLSNSTINNITNNNDIIIKKNSNNNLSISMNNITEFQTPLLSNKRLNLMKKYKDKKEITCNNNNKNISSKIVIKVNRTKFLERIKEGMKNKIISNQI